jgi:hypothetical protein
MLDAEASAPEVFEPMRRQLGVAHRVLDVLVTEIGLDKRGMGPEFRRTMRAQFGAALDAAGGAREVLEPRPAAWSAGRLASPHRLPY